MFYLQKISKHNAHTSLFFSFFFFFLFFGGVFFLFFLCVCFFDRRALTRHLTQSSDHHIAATSTRNTLGFTFSFSLWSLNINNLFVAYSKETSGFLFFFLRWGTVPLNKTFSLTFCVRILKHAFSLHRSDLPKFVRLDRRVR